MVKGDAEGNQLGFHGAEARCFNHFMTNENKRVHRTMRKPREFLVAIPTMREGVRWLETFK